jgi:hypothetical protein
MKPIDRMASLWCPHARVANTEWIGTNLIEIWDGRIKCRLNPNIEGDTPCSKDDWARCPINREASK